MNPDLCITPEDIDICHELPRKDGAKAHVIKFISRKTKEKVVSAKKQGRDYKFRNNNIFINDHLTAYGKKLFGTAKKIKKDKHYKFLWTRNGKIFIKKNEDSSTIYIDSDDVLRNL